VSDAGNIKYEIPETEKGHGDRAWALALALRASGGAYSGVGQFDAGQLGIL
jgi:phage FluMu gp28-like protein